MKDVESKPISDSEFKSIADDIANIVNSPNNKSVDTYKDEELLNTTKKSSSINLKKSVSPESTNSNPSTSNSFDILQSMLNDNTSNPDTQASLDKLANDIDIPDIDIAGMSIPDIDIAGMSIPDIDIPNMSIPSTDMPNIDMPNIELSDEVLSGDTSNEDVTFEENVLDGVNGMNSLDILMSNEILSQNKDLIDNTVHEQIIPNDININTKESTGFEISLNNIENNTTNDKPLSIKNLNDFYKFIIDNNTPNQAKELLKKLSDEWKDYREWWKTNFNDGDYNMILEDKRRKNLCSQLLKDLNALNKERPYMLIGNLKFYFKPHYLWVNEDYNFDVFSFTEINKEDYTKSDGNTNIDKVYSKELNSTKFLNTIMTNNSELSIRCFRLLYEPVYDIKIYNDISNLYSTLSTQISTIKTKLTNNEVNLNKERAKQLDLLQDKKVKAMQQLYKELEFKKIEIQNKYKEESDRRKAKLNEDITVKEQQFAELKAQLLSKHKEALDKFDNLINSANTLDNNLRLLLGDRIYKSLKAYYNDNNDISVYDIQCSNDCLEMINGLSDDLYDLISQQQHNHANLINKLANLPFTVTDYTKKLLLSEEPSHLNELKGSCIDMFYILVGTYLLILLRLYLLPTAVGTLAIKSINNTILLNNLKNTYGQFVEVLNNPTKLKERYSELLIQELLGGKQAELDTDIDNLKQFYGKEETKARNIFNKALKDLDATYNLNQRIIDLEEQFNKDTSAINKDFDTQIEDRKVSYTERLTTLQNDLDKLDYLCKLICHTVLSTPSIDSAVPRNNFVVGEIVNNEFNYNLPLISTFKEGSYAIVYNSNIEGSYDEALNLFRINLLLMTFGVSINTLFYNVFDTLSGDEIKQCSLLRYNTANMFDKPDLEELVNSNKETIKILTSDEGVLSTVVKHSYNSLQEYNLELSKSEGAILEKYKYNLFISYDLHSIFAKPLTSIILQKPIYGIYNFFLVDKAHVENLIEKSKKENSSSKDSFIDLFNSLIDLIPNVIDITEDKIKLCNAINTSSYATKNSYFSTSDIPIPKNCSINYYSV